jgi:hypothetical protein
MNTRKIDFMYKYSFQDTPLHSSLAALLFVAGLISAGCDNGSQETAQRNKPSPSPIAEVENNNANIEVALADARRAINEKNYQEVLALTAPLLNARIEAIKLHDHAQQEINKVQDAIENERVLSAAEALINELASTKPNLGSLPKEELVNRIDSLQSAANNLLQIESMKLSEVSSVKTKIAIKKLKAKLSGLQSKEFPLLRKLFAKHLAQTMWEHNIYVSVNGSNNSILEYAGGHFANNANIKESQESSHEVLTKFRFKQARYKWYRQANEYTYYKIESPKDSEITFE